MGVPPAALAWRQAAALRGCEDSELLTLAASAHPAAARAWLSREELERLRLTCQQAASASGVDQGEELLIISSRYEWPEIAESLAANVVWVESQLSNDFSPGRLALLLSAAGQYDRADQFAIAAFSPRATQDEAGLPVEFAAALREGFELAAQLDRLAAAIAWTRRPRS